MDLNFHGPMGPLPVLFAVLSGLAWLAVLAGVVLLVMWAIRALPVNPLMRSTPAVVESPLDTLARRFAQGDITAEEFERSRDLLRGGSPQP
jgi:uncharacterized membrane protein